MSVQIDESFTPRRIHRIRAQDFTRYGQFAHIQVPYQTPIPKEILDYIFGEDHESLGQKAELKLLLQLHDLIGKEEMVICADCGTHLQQRVNSDDNSKLPLV